ncbi:unnamed protein product [Owenia fusiformis]|uniref:BUD13 homolog n=1 Tax=Owenia fusiformis TaxID=6347 RepID=A0A8S4PV82_OWEFU|nr:unnamed protein product [Owenia fusiformis]
MTALSKEEYLKRYLSPVEGKGKKKKKLKIGVKAPTVRIVDDDVDFSTTQPDNNDGTIDDFTGDNDPTVAEVVDERPEHIKRLEAYRKSEKWKTVDKDKEKNGSDHNTVRLDADSDQSPVRKRHDSDSDQSPVRKRHDSDSDQSPVRKRHDSDSDQSPVRKSHDSDSDQSPVRKRHDSDSDQSPVRKRHSHSNQSPRRRKGRNSDSDQSPPRRKRKNSDSDQSPPRRKRKNSDSDQSPPRRNRKNSDSDQSPPRRNRKISDSDKSPPRKKPTKTLSGATAGLSSMQEMKREADKLRQKEKDAFNKVDADILGKNAATVFRDRKSGRKRDMKAEHAETEEETAKLAEKQEKYSRWSKGVKQQEDQHTAISNALHEMSKPLARYKDDDDLDDLLRQRDREDDPMLAFIKKKTPKGSNKKQLPLYKGPAAPPNRFNIQPGYRWDGVDRSNGFEKKIFQTQSNSRAVAEIAYKWSVEDM